MGMPLEINSSVRKSKKENQECTSGDYYKICHKVITPILATLIVSFIESVLGILSFLEMQISLKILKKNVSQLENILESLQS